MTLGALESDPIRLLNGFADKGSTFEGSVVISDGGQVFTLGAGDEPGSARRVDLEVVVSPDVVVEVLAPRA